MRKVVASGTQENHSRARLHGALILRTPAWRSLYSPSATAGTAPASSGTASGSICPKNFTLPTSNTTTNGSFSNLITQTSANANTIVQAPLMFVRGGFVVPGNNLRYAGYYGYYWSSVGRNSSGAYALIFLSGSVSPSGNYTRYSGFSVRCVALGG